MSIISYAQNFEDVMLWRALKHVNNGFYIDVGANDPVVESVTKLFYDNGWSGINIEPIKTHAEDLKSNRSRDINLNCAAGNQDGTLELWQCCVRGWATVDPKVMEMHEAAGYKGVRYHVPVQTLQSICQKYVSTDIHFMKVDVEGFEKAVLEGMDFRHYRPWILLVEATVPGTPDENHTEWEHIVTSAEYSFVYSDGLNRFYVANEKIELRELLKYPPNVFDAFKSASLNDAEVKIQQAEAKAGKADAKAEQAVAKAQQADAKAQQADAKAQQADAKAQQAQAQLAAIYSSTSWRVTAPLRWLSHQHQLMRQRGLKSRINSLIKKSTRGMAAIIDETPKLKRCLVSVLRKTRLESKVRQIYCRLTFVPVSKHYGYAIPENEMQLSPRARQIYHDLKVAVKEIKDNQ